MAVSHIKNNNTPLMCPSASKFLYFGQCLCNCFLFHACHLLSARLLQYQNHVQFWVFVKYSTIISNVQCLT